MRGFLHWSLVPDTWRGRKRLHGQHIVYALVDPRDETVRYVGVTRASLMVRLARHLDSPTNAGCAAWFAELGAACAAPDIRGIYPVDGGRWEQAEIYWIAWFRARGELLNVDPGGQYRGDDSTVSFKRLSAAQRAERIVAKELATGRTMGPPLNLLGRTTVSRQPPPRFHSRPKAQPAKPKPKTPAERAAEISARQMRSLRPETQAPPRTEPAPALPRAKPSKFYAALANGYKPPRRT